MRRYVNILVGLIYTGFGLYLWSRPMETLVSYSLYLSFVHLLGAIASFVVFKQYKLKPIPYGLILVSFVIGCAILALPLASMFVLIAIFVASFLGAAAFYLFRLLRHRDKSSVFSIVIAGIAVVYGIVMFFNPVMAANTLAKVIAVFVMMNGVSYLLTAFSKDEADSDLKATVLEAQEEVKEEVAKEEVAKEEV